MATTPTVPPPAATLPIDAATCMRHLATAINNPAALPLVDIAALLDALETLLAETAAPVRHCAAGMRHLEEQQSLQAVGGGGVEPAVSGVLRGLLTAEEGLAIGRGGLREAKAALASLTAASAPAAG
ncbi:hypothetical protein ACFV3R_25100 [Streptomyces sp. NPDC059740]|uniref:hypothetical protein n=1 Tax=Streptomyces sp. NPDC059740 TaxID=3346926 RepID=UPI00365DE078